MHTHTETNDPRRNRQVALAYGRVKIPTFPALAKPPAGAGKGWSKQPLVKGWAATASADDQQINRWWREHPFAVPGIPLEQINGIVIDLDRHGSADGVEAFNDLVEIHGPVPVGPVTETAGGGLHLIFRQPFGKRLGNRSGDLPAGIDVRGYGGWIVAPGSIRPDGKLWMPKPGTPLLTEAFKSNTIPVIPQWIVDLIEPKSRREKPPRYDRPDHDFAPYAQRALTLIGGDLARMTEGRRNIELNNAAMRLGSMVARGWLDQHEVVDSLWRACEANGLVADDGADAVQATIASGFAAGLRNPAKDPEDRPPPVGMNGTRERTQNGANDRRPHGANGRKPTFNWREGAISAQALMVKTFPDIVYIVPGILPEGVTLLVGRPKVGKSWWALDLCIAVAGDGLFMVGVSPGIRGDVLYLALEDNQRRLQRRMKKLLGKANIPERLTFHTEWRRVDEGGIDDMTAWLDEHPNAKLIVVDTLQKVRPIAGSDGYAKDYMAIEPLQKLAGERGISILVLHHDRKAEADDVFDTISGTLGLTGSTDAMLVLKRDPSVRFILHGRGRDIEDFEKAMTFDKDSCLWRVVGDAEEERLSKQRRAILAAIDDGPKEAGKPVGIGPKDIAAACRMKEANVKVLLGNMLRNGEVEQAEKGKYVLPKHPDQSGAGR